MGSQRTSTFSNFFLIVLLLVAKNANSIPSKFLASYKVCEKVRQYANIIAKIRSLDLLKPHSPPKSNII